MRDAAENDEAVAGSHDMSVRSDGELELSADDVGDLLMRMLVHRNHAAGADEDFADGGAIAMGIMPRDSGKQVARRDRGEVNEGHKIRRGAG